MFKKLSQKNYINSRQFGLDNTNYPKNQIFYPFIIFPSLSFVISSYAEFIVQQDNVKSKV